MADRTTPRPWRVVRAKIFNPVSGDMAYEDCDIIGANGRRVAVLTQRKNGKPPIGDAILIVEGVNAHEALVEACQTCTTLLDIDNDPDRIWGQSAKETMLRALYHALELARGDKEGE